MRKYYKYLLQDFLAEEIRRYRAENGMTQEQMAEALRVSPRSYIDLEHKKYGCSAVTAFFFLIRLDMETLLRLLNDFRALVERADRHDVA
nr:helix-turn-helix domain-containing protein [uncultured Dysosmobacter sp.]